jgi:hypothetical protein
MPIELRLSDFHEASSSNFNSAFKALQKGIDDSFGATGGYKMRILLDGARRAIGRRILPTIKTNQGLVLPRHPNAQITVEGEDPSTSNIEFRPGDPQTPLISWQSSPVRLGGGLGILGIVDEHAHNVHLKNFSCRKLTVGPIIEYAPCVIRPKESEMYQKLETAELRSTLIENLVLHAEKESSTPIVNLHGTLWATVRNVQVKGAQANGCGVRVWGSYANIENVYSPMKEDAPSVLVQMQSGHGTITRCRTEGGNGTADILIGTDVWPQQWICHHRVFAPHVFFPAASMIQWEEDKKNEAEQNYVHGVRVQSCSSEGNLSKAFIRLHRCFNATMIDLDVPRAERTVSSYKGLEFVQSSHCRVIGGKASKVNEPGNFVAHFDRVSARNTFDYFFIEDVVSTKTTPAERVGLGGPGIHQNRPRLIQSPPRRLARDLAGLRGTFLALPR